MARSSVSYFRAGWDAGSPRRRPAPHYAIARTAMALKPDSTSTLSSHFRAVDVKRAAATNGRIGTTRHLRASRIPAIPVVDRRAGPRLEAAAPTSSSWPLQQAN